jgi:hypothetical protein
MEISLNTRNYGYFLTIKADNVLIEEDIEQRTYFKTEDGKTDFKKAPIRDVSTDALDQFARLLDDMIHYREARFDSSDLIERLFEKLPKDKADELLKSLVKTYGEDED